MQAGGQLRLAPMGGVTGFDMTTLLPLTRARGVPLAATELTPHSEGTVVATPARQPRSGSGDGADV